MAKWRPVDVRVWNDRKVLALSDRGKVLWLYLLTSPFMLPIPGVIVAGEMAIAEQLGWQPKGVGEGFGELLAKGLGVTRFERLIWLHKALSYQPICGPNHISAIAKCWDDVPHCAMKHAIWVALRNACKGWGKLFEKGVPEPLPEPLANPIAEPIQDPFHTVSGSGSGSGELALAYSDSQANPPKQNRARAKGVRVAAHRMPQDWAPRQQELDKAAAMHVQVAIELELFRDHHTAKGSTFVDWDAAFRTWLGNASRFANGTVNGFNGRSGPRAAKSPIELQMERIAMLEAREARERSGTDD